MERLRVVSYDEAVICFDTPGAGAGRVLRMVEVYYSGAETCDFVPHGERVYACRVLGCTLPPADRGQHRQQEDGAGHDVVIVQHASACVAADVAPCLLLKCKDASTSELCFSVVAVMRKQGVRVLGERCDLELRAVNRLHFSGAAPAPRCVQLVHGPSVVWLMRHRARHALHVTTPYVNDTLLCKVAANDAMKLLWTGQIADVSVALLRLTRKEAEKRQSNHTIVMIQLFSKDNKFPALTDVSPYFSDVYSKAVTAVDIVAASAVTPWEHWGGADTPPAYLAYVSTAVGWLMEFRGGVLMRRCALPFRDAARVNRCQLHGGDGHLVVTSARGGIVCIDYRTFGIARHFQEHVKQVLIADFLGNGNEQLLLLLETARDAVCTETDQGPRDAVCTDTDQGQKDAVCTDTEQGQRDATDQGPRDVPTDRLGSAAGCLRDFLLTDLCGYESSSRSGSDRLRASSRESLVTAARALALRVETGAVALQSAEALLLSKRHFIRETWMNLRRMAGGDCQPSVTPGGDCQPRVTPGGDCQPCVTPGGDCQSPMTPGGDCQPCGSTLVTLIPGEVSPIEGAAASCSMKVTETWTKVMQSAVVVGVEVVNEGAGCITSLSLSLLTDGAACECRSSCVRLSDAGLYSNMPAHCMAADAGSGALHLLTAQAEAEKRAKSKRAKLDESLPATTGGASAADVAAGRRAVVVASCGIPAPLSETVEYCLLLHWQEHDGRGCSAAEAGQHGRSATVRLLVPLADLAGVGETQQTPPPEGAAPGERQLEAELRAAGRGAAALNAVQVCRDVTLTSLSTDMRGLLSVLLAAAGLQRPRRSDYWCCDASSPLHGVRLYIGRAAGRRRAAATVYGWNSMQLGLFMRTLSARLPADVRILPSSCQDAAP